MNSAFPVWDYLWVAMTWAFYALAWVGALILVFALIVGMVRGVQSWRKPKKKPLSRQRVLELAEPRAVLRYKHQPNADWRTDCFMEGVEEALDILDHK